MKAKGFFIKFSAVTATDIAEIKELERECRLSIWSAGDYLAEIGRTDSIQIAAKAEDKIAGFIVARLIRTEIPESYEIEVYNICVTERYRRKGIGKILISKLIEATNRKINSVWLEVRKSNEEAISFYKRQGFEVNHIRTNFYSNPTEDGLVMKLITSKEP